MEDPGKKKIIMGKPALRIPNISYGQYTLDKLRDNPLRIVQVDGETGAVMTNRDILGKSVKLALILNERGIRIGDTVAISAENHAYWFVAACAILYTGATAVPMNPVYAEGECIHCLKIARPKIIFVSRRSEALISRIKAVLQWPMEIIELDESLDTGIPCLEKIFNQSRAWPDPYEYNAVKLDRPETRVALVLYSSGTTGFPKGVMLSHRNLFLQEFSMLHPDVLNFNRDDVLLMIPPFFHGYGFGMMIDAINVGATAIVMSSFKPDIYLDAIGKYKVSVVLALPTIINFLAKHPMVSRYDYRSVRTIVSGGAPLSPETSRQALIRLGDPILRVGYGMTELSIVSTMSARDTRKPESIGRPVPGKSCKIIDPKTSESLGPGQPGELCFKGDHVMLGYMNDPDMTRNTIDDEGWLHTGDLGYYDQDGDLFLIGRLKELIKYKGYQVSPRAIEDVLTEHPDVVEAAVIGRPDEASGELPMAFVVSRPGSASTAGEIAGFVNERVSPHSRIRAGVHFLKAIPKTPSGKILRRELLKLVAKI